MNHDECRFQCPVDSEKLLERLAVMEALETERKAQNEALRRSIEELQRTASDLRAGLQTLNVKSGLIGTIAAMIVTLSVLGFEWLKSRVGAK